MPQLQSKIDQEKITIKYTQEGFVAPLDIITKEEAQVLRDDFENAELELADKAEKLALLKAYPERLLPSFDRLIRNENLISAASAVLGPNLMV